MSLLSLRPYQREALDAIHAACERGLRRLLLVLATGGGKTVCFSHLIREREGRAIVIAHRDELCQQAAEKIAMISGEKPGIVKADRDEVGARIIVASAQTLARPQRLERLLRALNTPTLFGEPEPLRTIIQDEAHHAPMGDEGNTFGRILDALMSYRPEPLLLGCTATPDPLTAGEGGLAGGWQEIAFTADVLAGIRGGWLVDLKGKEVKLAGADFRELHTTHGEIRADEADAMLLAADAPRHAARAYLEQCPGETALVFTPSVATAHAFAAAFREAGVTAEAVSGETPTDERRAILRRLADGTTRVVCNCAVLTEGFDCPRVSVVIMARPTKSRVFAMQAVGRALRPYPGKLRALVLDLVGSVRRVDLMTVSAMFGVPQDRLAKDGLLEASEAPAIIAPGQPVQDDSRLVARDLDLLKGRQFAWVTTNSGKFVLSLGAEGSLQLEQRADDPERWDVYKVGRPEKYGSGWRTPKVKLFAGLTIDYATGQAEDVMRQSGAARLNDKGAGWRSLPASEKQKGMLTKKRRWVDGMTRGQASDALSAIFAR